MRVKFFILCALALTIFSCGKSKTEKDNSFATKAETKPQFDKTSFGVYKGVIVGSSGYIVFRINNGDNVVKGFLKIDGREDVLTTNEVLVAGKAISNVLFTGSFSSMRLSADADGKNAELSDIKIEGHKYAGGYISHEKSNQQIILYEGTFNGIYSGIFNIARVGTGQHDSLFALMKFSSDTLLHTGHGFNEDSLRLSFYSYFGEIKFVAKKIPDAASGNIDGTWFYENQNAGAFAVKRTY